MSRRLSPEERASYARDGVLFPIPVLAPAEVVHFRSAFEALSARLGGEPKSVPLLHLFFRWARDLACHPAVVDVVEDLLGPDVLAQATLVLCKYPGDSSYVSWHQDGLTSGWHRSPSTSAWIALSESSADTGCMRVVPGSHVGEILPHREVKSPNNLLRRGEEVEVPIDERRIVNVALGAGEMSLHHSKIVHGSMPHQAGDKRIGFIVRFVTPEFHFQQPPHPVVRARGGASPAHLEVVSGPEDDEVDRGFAEWQRFLRGRGLAVTGAGS